MTMPRLMQGNEACAEGALAAGLGFFAGYPITPSTEIAEILADRLPRIGGVFIQMEDEIASMAAVIGASLAGKKSMTATSGPGFSLKQENLGYASMTEIPCVIVNVQRKGPSTGMPTSPAQGDVMQARWGTHGDHPIIVLTPSSVAETFELTVRAFNLAEKYRVPVILLMDEVVAHLREKVILPETVEVVNRKKPTVAPGEYFPYRASDDTDVPPLAAFGEGYRFHVTGLFHDETGFPTGDPQEASRQHHRLMGKIDRHRANICQADCRDLEDAELVIVAYGSVARSAMRAVRIAREKGFKVGLVRPVTIWPFPDEVFEGLGEQVRGVLVAEMNFGQIALEVQRLSAGRYRTHLLSKVNGEIIAPGEILDRIEEVY